MTRIAAFIALSLFTLQAQAAPKLQRIATRYDFTTLLARLETAISDHNMILVARASASQGAATRGIVVPGNAILMVFRNDFALRLLQANRDAGIEAPIRFYVTEEPDHSASLAWQTPSEILAPYASPAIDGLSQELDDIFTAIARQATSP